MFRNIQLLRAVGAAMVLLLHFHPHYVAMEGLNPLLMTVMPYGFVGVDIFFAVSGFVMMHVISGQAPIAANVGEFIGRRFLRIYGWYLPCLAFTTVVAAFYDPDALSRADLFRSATLTTVDLQRLALPVSWSLSYEVYFYLAVALGWVLFASRLHWALWAGAILLAAWSVLVPYRPGSLLSFLTSPLVLEFLAGALFYVHKEHLARRGLLPLYAAAAVGFFWMGVHENAIEEFIRIRTFGAGSFFLLCFFVTLEEAGIYRAGKLVNALGDASFSIYLLHMPFMSVFFGSGLRDQLQAANDLVGEIGFFTYLLGICALCVALHYFIERPMYRALSGRLLSWRRRGSHPAPTPERFHVKISG